MAELTPADYAAINGNEGMGGMGGWWLIILFALIFGGNGFGFGNRGNVATTDEVAAGFNFSGINNKLNELVAGQANINQNLGNAICQLGYQDLQNFSNLEKQLAECCCATQRAVDSVKFDLANYSAATNQTVATWGQKILDKLCADQVAALQGRVQQLELQQAMCGVMKYPTSATYAAAPPAFGCNPCYAGAY